jgi:hypothetical protein
MTNYRRCLENQNKIMLEQGISIKFTDTDTNDEAIAIVRYDENSVVVALSHKSNGDIQVVMKKEDAKKFFEALKKAVA